MATNHEQPKGLIESFEQDSDLNKKVVEAMHNNPKTAQLMRVWDYLKSEQQKRAEWLQEETNE